MITVELPDLGETIAKMVEDYQKELEREYPDHLIDNKHAEKCAQIWLDSQFERAKRILIERDRKLSELSLKNNKG